jgi:hypothetical protein
MFNSNLYHVKAGLEKIWKTVFRSTVIIFLLVILAIGLFILRRIPEDTRFNKQYSEAAKRATEVLLYYNECPNKDCHLSRTLFVNGYYKGMEVKINGVKDSMVLKEVCGVFIKTFANTPEMKRAIIEVRPEREPSKEIEKQPFTIELRRD